MPRAVYVLGLAIFAQGTSELMLAGLLPELSTDLGVSIPAAGLLISAFALGMLVGAPLLAVLTARRSRQATLLILLAIFVLAHLVAALTSDYGVLLATRVVAAFVYAGFWTVASVAAVGLAGPAARGRAMSIVAGGLTVATVVGLPAGTALAQHLGWRAAFWAVAVLSAAAMIMIVRSIPGGRPAETGSLRDELTAIRNPRLWLAYAITAVSTAALLATFSYLAPLLIEATGVPASWVPLILGLYGVGSVIGIAVGGRFADRRPFATLAIAIAGVAVWSAALAIMTGSMVIAIPAIVLLGAFGFASNPAINARVFGLAGRAPTLAAAFNISAFNLGITLGPYLGGRVLEAGAGYSFVAVTGALLAVLALGLVALAHRTEPRRRAAGRTLLRAR
ncbi:Cmx/CmrA family chloramphenicol efflux MFS transporter [Microlunatus speluncae]|uniref:Cmx/CmrA family chloramphenicol efflux MFS transporter n=1 Tax=Microlunatus speluncae TaxID=2594267 RepID=UPI00126617A8|nr:Cmx/CmrA family chloramphenicol efflux MFS transporter [Microlunatus speluncae]